MLQCHQHNGHVWRKIAWKWHSFHCLPSSEKPLLSQSSSDILLERIPGGKYRCTEQRCLVRRLKRATFCCRWDKGQRIDPEGKPLPPAAVAEINVSLGGFVVVLLLYFCVALKYRCTECRDPEGKPLPPGTAKVPCKPS